MVRAFFALLILFSVSSAHALLGQSRKDLRAVEDRLRYEFAPKAQGGLGSHLEILPILVAPPQAYWQESQADFGPEMLAVLARVFPEPGSLIDCLECYSNRVFVARDNRMVVQNGELSLSDLARLKTHPGYEHAKSVLMTRETPSGIQILLLAIDDGRILYTGVADANQTLNSAEPPLRLARELERRERGEALSYVFTDLGLYPTLTFQMKWLEQWGSHNQNLSGFAVSLYNPTGALGGTYQYMLPFKRQATIGLTGYYSLQSLFKASDASTSSNFIAQISFNYAISGAYGVFVSADTAGNATVGLSLLNPVFMPFLF